MDTHSPVLRLVRTFPLAADRRVSLGAEIGRGIAATVYRGQLLGPGGGPKIVAVKLLDVHPGGFSARVLESLEDAVQRAACVHHPHTAQTYDFNLRWPEPFVVTELVDGGSLERLTEAYTRNHRQVPQEIAILIALKVAEGMSRALSAAQLVHGNLTARDVLISWSGEVKVADFGLHVASSGVSMVRPIESVARVAAIAPEVACGAVPDARADVFSLGILLHELMLGQRFSPHTSPGEARGLVRDGVVHRSLMEPQLVQPLRALLRRCIEKDPARRYGTAGEVAVELKSIARLLGIPDVPAYIGRAVEEIFAEGRPAALESCIEIRDDEIYDAEIFDDPDSEPTLSTPAPSFEDF